jgi:putative FmdB family regulatory protein
VPIYAYKCQTCGIQFDRRQSFTAKPLTRCPECGGQVKRLIQPVGIVFKGSGWYVTDHRPADKSSSDKE